MRRYWKEPRCRRHFTEVEMLQKTLESGMAGDNVGILLRGIQKTEIECGMVLSKPGTIVSKILTLDIIYNVRQVLKF